MKNFRLSTMWRVAVTTAPADGPTPAEADGSMNVVADCAEDAVRLIKEFFAAEDRLNAPVRGLCVELVTQVVIAT
jgi:hypothetical protein